MKTFVVLLSAGLDSATNLFAAARAGEVKLALTFNYGQRAAESEIQHARLLCEQLNIPHHVIDLPWLKQITRTALVNRSAAIPVGGDVAIDDKNISEQTAKAVWVPNRNGVFLNIAASFAESLGAEYVVPGFNVEEAVTFPDNSKEFISALDASFALSTATCVKVKCFTQDMDKTTIVRFAREVGVPFDLLWPCYFSGEELCGLCESCRRFERALKVAFAGTSADSVVEGAP